jgi:hypothetical protein
MLDRWKFLLLYFLLGLSERERESLEISRLVTEDGGRRVCPGKWVRVTSREDVYG